jgi:phosphate transport system protein
MTEARERFRRNMAALEQQTLGALELVLVALDRILESLEHRDVELAQIVIDEDRAIDARHADVHNGVIALLALQAPVAGDLRLLAAMLHVVRYAERMGDQCVAIAKLIPVSGHEPPIRREILDGVLTMGRCARAEVVQCKHAFAQRSVVMAEDLVQRDFEVNRLNRDIFRLAVEAGDDADTREWAMTMTLVARAFERVGDNAIDVGEQTAFVVTGVFREFSSAVAADAWTLNESRRGGPYA